MLPSVGCPRRNRGGLPGGASLSGTLEEDAGPAEEDARWLMLPFSVLADAGELGSASTIGGLCIVLRCLSGRIKCYTLLSYSDKDTPKT